MNPISAALALVVWCATLCAADAIPPQQHRQEVCPGALYFHSGTPPAWAAKKHLVCHIGRHYFYSDKPRSK